MDQCIKTPAGELATEYADLIPFAEVKLPGRNGKHVHPATIYKWAMYGLQSRSGRQIRLEAEFIGGRLYTTAKAIERFFLAKDDLKPRAVPENNSRASARLDKQHAEALKVLRSRGVKC